MKYIVWIIEERGGEWEPNGEGPMTRAQADRIARETRNLCAAVKVLPAGIEPKGA